MIGYVARDRSDLLYFHYTLPVRDAVNEWWSDDDAFALKSELVSEFNNLTYNDEPVKVELTIKKV